MDEEETKVKVEGEEVVVPEEETVEVPATEEATPVE
ncbi:MAG: hypothetical protein UR85_C0007G0017 [Candidatus Nomurabacteria bacterium GW2011_GWF2_35_66]|uniref:Uncharacterized protein n=1 Tax=Candidatus Nomurabacteria bacterium GW2011_GWE1_35_16 TaxID=1618761 RepID=A0A0G0BAF6_9BACT|nr:MAG: hypothetical protein UR55_C0009G0041 [Candidatus Nomurabacteria bacterium GW2011_GWF1_34_20]KKP62999.1 MAG: hypothetical protein UR57_C0009G0042 [Candidatus Nomurabacteria bacterium GW2011_GWE2_34_25]KKP66403.1 MAG: hypothetical protein UR64_C0008G0041 [Candidatus Nomurabacteria bacterium GW2011_GWE1_35_16]KKP83157.1 MAG: hypothetical protein UR85_C0007G0017 [Candidatus Nomurabacteria bacterium GW2011_GWF2_35_66]